MLTSVETETVPIQPGAKKTGETVIERARRLRREATPAERVLWSALRRFRPQGFHFRRQTPIGPYIADFACKQSKIVIELDGSQHGEREQLDHDETRTASLTTRGYRVLRFWNHEVFENRDGVVDVIFRALGPTRPAARAPVPGR
jgi:very-short-patch-repair endonuclease